MYGRVARLLIESRWDLGQLVPNKVPKTEGLVIAIQLLFTYRPPPPKVAVLLDSSRDYSPPYTLQSIAKQPSLFTFPEVSPWHSDHHFGQPIISRLA